MKLSFVLLCLLFSLTSQAECFKEKVFNEYFVKILKKPCEEFPKEIMNWYVDLVAYEDIKFYQEDISRLVKLEYIDVISKQSGLITIGFEGMIEAPKLGSFSFYEGTFKLDTSNGAFVSSKALNVSANYNKTLIQDLRPIRMSKLIIYGDNGSMDNEKIILPQADLSIREFLAIKNSTLIGKAIDIDVDGGEITESTIEATQLSLYDLKEIGNNRFTVTKSLKLNNVKTKEILRLTEFSQLESLWMSYSKAGFSHPNVLKPLKDITVLESSLTELNFPETLDRLTKFSISNSTIDSWSLPAHLPLVTSFMLKNVNAIFGQWPKMPSLVDLTINKFDLAGVRGSLDIHEKLTYINLNDTKLVSLELDLVNPKKLGAVFFLGNPLSEIEVYNKENAKSLPPYFALYLKSKKTARRLRSLLKRRSVVSSVW